MNKISIVVPVYKVELYIERCMISILNQSYKNIEVILVDDGSPDKCGEICDSYEEKDQRVKVIHQENRGLSNARNTGLKIAKGEYVLFIDSDDYIALDSCEKFSAKFSCKPDIITGMARQVCQDKVKNINNYLDYNEDHVYTGPEIMKKQLENNLYPVVAWINIYKKDFLLNNQLLFKEKILHEDVEWTPRVFFKAQKVLATANRFYYYVMRDDSIMHYKNQEKNSTDLFDTFNFLLMLSNSLPDEELKEKFNNYLAMLYLDAFFKGVNSGIMHNKTIDRFLPIKLANKKKIKLISFLFSVNPKLYVWLRKKKIVFQNKQ